MAGIRVLIVDAQSLFREGVRLLLTSNVTLEVVGEAAHARKPSR